MRPLSCLGFTAACVATMLSAGAVEPALGAGFTRPLGQRSPGAAQYRPGFGNRFGNGMNVRRFGAERRGLRFGTGREFGFGAAGFGGYPFTFSRYAYDSYGPAYSQGCCSTVTAPAPRAGSTLNGIPPAPVLPPAIYVISKSAAAAPARAGRRSSAVSVTGPTGASMDEPMRAHFVQIP